MELEESRQQGDHMPPNTAPRKQPNRSRLYKTMAVILTIAVWGGLLYGGYYLANTYIQKNQEYIDEKVAQIKEQNHQQLKDFKSDINKEITNVQRNLDQVETNLTAIEKNIESTEEVITGANKTKKSLQEKIDELNKQLNELKTALKQLEDASQ